MPLHLEKKLPEEFKLPSVGAEYGFRHHYRGAAASAGMTVACEKHSIDDRRTERLTASLVWSFIIRGHAVVAVH